MNYYISDLHLGSKGINICINRSSHLILDAEQMDKYLINQWNSNVGKDDDVYIIGDACYKLDEQTTWKLKDLKGRKHLILGDQDDRLLDYPGAYYALESVEKMQYITDCGTQVVLCHYPMYEWYGSTAGSVLIYGHVQGSSSDSMEYMRVRGNALCAAACINNYRPVRLDNLIRNNKVWKEKIEKCPEQRELHIDNCLIN